MFLCDIVMTLFLEQALSPGSWNKLHKGFNQSQDISYCSFYQSLREKHQEVQVTYQTFCIFDIPSYSVNNSRVQQYSLLLREIKNLFSPHLVLLCALFPPMTPPWDLTTGGSRNSPNLALFHCHWQQWALGEAETEKYAVFSMLSTHTAFPKVMLAGRGKAINIWTLPTFSPLKLFSHSKYFSLGTAWR